MNADNGKRQKPIVFLTGPPGADKSTLGPRACDALGLKFLDFSDPESQPAALDDERRALQAVITHRSADVIALSWQLQQSDGVLKLAQKCETCMGHSKVKRNANARDFGVRARKGLHLLGVQDGEGIKA